MITGYFGLPRVGKTTLLARYARKANKRIKRDNERVAKGKKRRYKYDAVLTNFACKDCYQIDFSDIGTKYIERCLILLDEITCDADNRDYKNFKKSSVEGFVYHGHYHNDIVYFTQDWNAVDKKIRNLTFDLFYVKKSQLPFFNLFTKYTRIFRTIDINDMTKEIVNGYRFPNLFELILQFFGLLNLGGIIFRPIYYKDFDSFDKPLDLELFEFVSWNDKLFKKNSA